MSAAAYLIPLLVLLVLVVQKLLTSSRKWRDILELILGLSTLILTLINLRSDEITLSRRDTKIDSLLQKRHIDSINNDKFHRFLRDSMGIDRIGNRAQITNNTVYQVAISNSRNNKTFYLHPNGLEMIEELLSSKGYQRKLTSPQFNLLCTYSGVLDEVDNNLFRYSGGYILIKLNGLDCGSLPDLQIPPTFYGGNPRNLVEAELALSIKKICEQNPYLIFQVMSKCLK